MQEDAHSYLHYSASSARRIAVVTMGVKLGNEVRGYTRFRFLSELLAQEGFAVDLITSSFQHWDKAQRDCTDPSYQGHPYTIRFIHEPGYKRNLDLARIWSHRKAAQGLRAFFDAQFAQDPHAYDLIYAEIPPNDVARTCAEVAVEHDIPFVADINDLWPEAMRMAVDIPILSNIAFAPFARDARRVYELLTAAVGTSDEYAARPAADRSQAYPHITVYVGNDLSTFDAGANANRSAIQKPEGEAWVTYAGTLGASYDLMTLVKAASLLSDRMPDRRIRVKILGDGPDREALQLLVKDLDAPVDLVGYAPYDQMAAWLCASDVLVNSLVKTAPQSIVTKIGDYLSAAKPMVNTGSSPEFREKVEADGFGINVAAEDPEALADSFAELLHDPSRCKMMGAKARRVAEEQFNQPRSYQAIVDLIHSLTEPHGASLPIA